MVTTADSLKFLLILVFAVNNSVAQPSFYTDEAVDKKTLLVDSKKDWEQLEQIIKYPIPSDSEHTQKVDSVIQKFQTNTAMLKNEYSTFDPAQAQDLLKTTVHYAKMHCGVVNHLISVEIQDNNLQKMIKNIFTSNYFSDKQIYRKTASATWITARKEQFENENPGTTLENEVDKFVQLITKISDAAFDRRDFLSTLIPSEEPLITYSCTQKVEANTNTGKKQELEDTDVMEVPAGTEKKQSRFSRLVHSRHIPYTKNYNVSTTEKVFTWPIIGIVTFVVCVVAFVVVFVGFFIYALGGGDNRSRRRHYY